MKITKTFILIFIFTIFGCDKIDDPIPSDLGTSIAFGEGVEFIPSPELGLTDSASIRNFIDSNVWTLVQGADNSTRRFIILEEFTGHKCTSCPKGTREILRLQDRFKEQLIPVGIHTGQFAKPNAPGSFMYTTDFRIKSSDGSNEDVGKAYSDRFVVDGNPRGVVSRIGTVEPETAWESSIEAILGDQPKAKLDITNYYDSINHVVRSQIDIEWLESLSEGYNLQLYAIEGKIFDWQLDGPLDDPDYEHKFVLRKIVNGTFGKSLKPANLGDEEKIQYIFSLDNNWVGKNMEVVAFIFNNDQTVNEVIQANSAFLQ